MCQTESYLLLLERAPLCFEATTGATDRLCDTFAAECFAGRLVIAMRTSTSCSVGLATPSFVYQSHAFKAALFAAIAVFSAMWPLTQVGHRNLQGPSRGSQCNHSTRQRVVFKGHTKTFHGPRYNWSGVYRLRPMLSTVPRRDSAISFKTQVNSSEAAARV